MKGGKWCIKCLKAPLKALTNVRNLYVKGMNGCAGKIQFPTAAIGYPNVYEYSSRSFNSTDSSRWGGNGDDLSELIRANSVGGYGRGGGKAGRSQSVVVGRIDEDEEVEFGRDELVGVGSDLLFPRSRSLAMRSKRRLGRAFGGV